METLKMIILSLIAAESVLTALLNREVTIEWAGDPANRFAAKLHASGIEPKKRGRKPGSKNKVKTAGKRKYTKRSKYWKK